MLRLLLMCGSSGKCLAVMGEVERVEKAFLNKNNLGNVLTWI